MLMDVERQYATILIDMIAQYKFSVSSIIEFGNLSEGYISIVSSNIVWDCKPWFIRFMDNTYTHFYVWSRTDANHVSPTLRLVT